MLNLFCESYRLQKNKIGEVHFEKSDLRCLGGAPAHVVGGDEELFGDLLSGAGWEDNLAWWGRGGDGGERRGGRGL